MSENEQTVYDYLSLDSIFVARCNQCGNKASFEKSGGWVRYRYTYSVGCNMCNVSVVETLQQDNALEPLHVLEEIAIKWNVKQGIHPDDVKLIQSRYAAYAKIKSVISFTDDGIGSLLSDTYI